jgi:hypothetical protein
MDNRTLLALFVLITITIMGFGAWRASSATQECSKHGGVYSILEKRCLNRAPKVIIQRDLMRT